MASNADTWLADLRAAMAALVGLRTTDRPPRGCYLEMPGVEPEVAGACRFPPDGYRSAGGVLSAKSSE